MKIEKNVLVCVDESDLIDGRFINKKVTEVADKCFWNVPGLKSVILPKVKKIGSDCFSSNDALTEISLPVLAQCGSDCFRYNDALTEISLPVLAQCGSYCFSSNDALTEISLENLTQCGSYCFSYNDALTEISLENLTQCGSDCFRSNDALTEISLENLTQCGSDCFSSNDALTEISLENLTQCGSYCFSYNDALTEISLENLTQCGSDCFSSNDALTEISLPVLAQCGSDCFRYNDALTEISLGKHKLNVKNVDGYCYVIDSHRSSKGFKIYGGGNLKHVENNNLELDVCYVAEKEGKTAHGHTVKQAIEDVQFKLVSEKLKNEPITPETKITVQYYRMVTGACDLGCRHWMEANNIPYIVENKGTDRERTKEEGVIMASDILPLLEKTNAYGVERFKQLANWTD